MILSLNEQWDLKALFKTLKNHNPPVKVQFWFLFFWYPHLLPYTWEVNKGHWKAATTIVLHFGHKVAITAFHFLLFLAENFQFSSYYHLIFPIKVVFKEQELSSCFSYPPIIFITLRKKTQIPTDPGDVDHTWLSSRSVRVSRYDQVVQPLRFAAWQKCISKNEAKGVEKMVAMGRESGSEEKNWRSRKESIQEREHVRCLKPEGSGWDGLHISVVLQDNRGWIYGLREDMKVAGVREEDAEDRGDEGGHLTAVTSEEKSWQKKVRFLLSSLYRRWWMCLFTFKTRITRLVLLVCTRIMVYWHISRTFLKPEVNKNNPVFCFCWASCSRSSEQ